MKSKIIENVQDPEWVKRSEQLHLELVSAVEKVVEHQGHPQAMSSEYNFRTDSGRSVKIKIEVGAAAPAH